MKTFDLDNDSLRELNSYCHQSGADPVTADNANGRHAIAVGVNQQLDITINGNVGYYCAGMNQQANIVVNGHAGPGLAENMMSGSVRVTGNASQYCAATAHGGMVVIEGDASSRCGISMKGVTLVVRGNVGHMSAFMAQSGVMVVCGDAGDALGDSIYEARLYVRGEVASTGADCIEKEMQQEHLEELEKILADAGITDIAPTEFRRYGSERALYNFNIDNASAY